MACDPFWNKTVLACHFDGTNGSTTFTDEKGHALTANGNAQLTTTSPKFGTACATFDGTGDYIVAAASSDFVVGAGEFTIEGWFYFSGFASNHAYGTAMFDTRPVGALSNGMALFANSSGVLTAWDLNSTATQSASGKVTTGQWYHIALCRSGGRMRVFVDGVSVIDYAHTLNYAPATTTLIIGTVVDYQDTSANFKHNGKLDAVRFTKAARYTANFTPDASAFATNQCTISGTIKDSSGANAKRLVRVLDRKTCAVLGTALSDATTGAYAIEVATASEVMVVANDTSDADPLWDSVVLACHFDGSDGAKVFIDEKGRTLTANGNAQISTAQSQFGGASLYLDGTGDYISLAASADFAFGTGDFTVEFWVYHTLFRNYITAVSTRTGVNTSSWSIGTQAAANMIFYAGGEIVRDPAAMSANTWYHIAFVRASGVLTGYKNGVSFGSAANTYNFTADALRIGQDITYGEDFPGYIDDLRITKAARYTSNFTPPTQTFHNMLTGGTENAVILDRVVPV